MVRSMLKIPSRQFCKPFRSGRKRSARSFSGRRITSRSFRRWMSSIQSIKNDFYFTTRSTATLEKPKRYSSRIFPTFPAHFRRSSDSPNVTEKKPSSGGSIRSFFPTSHLRLNVSTRSATCARSSPDMSIGASSVLSICTKRSGRASID